MTDTRLLKPSELPAILWDADNGVLTLPQTLVDAYTHVIDRADLRDLASSHNSAKPPVGGLSQELTDEHLAQAFDGSAARAMLAFLDPHSHLAPVSNTFVEALAGNELCIVDAPCGAGATTYAFLTALADLRAEGVLPRMPLDVRLIGADLSDPARVYAAELLLLLKDRLEEQAIFVSEEFRPWDATNKLSTMELNRKIIEISENRVRRLVLLSNFSGFLEQSGKRKKAEPQLEEMFRYMSGPGCAAIWIEPQTNRATINGGTFSWLIGQAKGGWQRFMTVAGLTDRPCFISSARFREPLDSGQTPKVRLAVVPIHLEASA